MLLIASISYFYNLVFYKQRLIIRALENTDVVILRDLLPGISEYIKKYGGRWLEKACSESEAK